MRGELGDEMGGTARLYGDGPIDVLISEHTAARTILSREVSLGCMTPHVQPRHRGWDLELSLGDPDLLSSYDLV